MPASFLILLALVGQPPRDLDDGPVQTAPKEQAVAADPFPGPDEKTAAIPPAAKPKSEERTALTVAPKTAVEGETLQVVLGQRALFHLDGTGRPVLDKVEEGKLAAAHPQGAVTETFEPPPAGQIAVALDGSAETRTTVLKVWNSADKAVEYSAIALVMAQGKVTPSRPPVCGVPAGSVRTESWPRPVVAVGLQRFKRTTTTKACQ